MRKRPPVNHELVEEMSYKYFKTDIEEMLTIQKKISGYLLTGVIEQARKMLTEHGVSELMIGSIISSLDMRIIQLLFHQLDSIERVNLLKDEFFYHIEEMAEDRVAELKKVN